MQILEVPRNPRKFKILKNKRKVNYLSKEEADHL